MTTLIDKRASPSPFSPTNPRLQLAWDSMSLKLLKECQRRYQYQMILGYQPRGLKLTLQFGLNYHSILENYEKDLALGMEKKDALTLACARGLAWDDSPFKDEPGYTVRNRATLARAVVWNILQFDPGGRDTAKTVILHDGTPALELSFRYFFDEINGEMFFLCGHLDRLVDYEEDRGYIDRKTTGSQLNERYFRQFNPNTQFTHYCAAVEIVCDNASGGLVEAVQLLVNGARYARRFIKRTRRQIDEWHRDTLYWLRQAAIYARDDYWPMNDNSCNNYGGCPFIPVCAIDPTQRAHVLEHEYDKWEWNPLEIR